VIYIKILFFILLFVLLINPVTGFDLELDTNISYPTTRDFNTEYINNHSYPIIVRVSYLLDITIDIGFTNLRVDGVIIDSQGFYELISTTKTGFSHHFIVPSNKTYEIIQTGNITQFSIIIWTEYKTSDDLPVIYQNVTNENNLKSFIISDDLNIDYLTDYNYTIFLDGVYWKEISKDEILLFPDNSSIIIYLPSPIMTNFDDITDYSKTYLYISIMYVMGFLLGLLIIIFVITKILKKK